MMQVEGRIIVKADTDLQPEQLLRLEMYLNGQVADDTFRLFKAGIRVHLDSEFRSKKVPHAGT